MRRNGIQRSSLSREKQHAFLAPTGALVFILVYYKPKGCPCPHCPKRRRRRRKALETLKTGLTSILRRILKICMIPMKYEGWMANFQNPLESKKLGRRTQAARPSDCPHNFSPLVEGWWHLKIKQETRYKYTQVPSTRDHGMGNTARWRCYGSIDLCGCDMH